MKAKLVLVTRARMIDDLAASSTTSALYRSVSNDQVHLFTAPTAAASGSVAGLLIGCRWLDWTYWPTCRMVSPSRRSAIAQLWCS